jgi:hypothetical protein
MTWKEYRELVKESSKDYKENQLQVYATGLCSEVGELFKCDNEDYKNNSVDNVNRQLEIGDVLWFIAALENIYNLPENIYHNTINLDIEVEDGILSRTTIYADLMCYCGDIIEAISIGNTLEIQYKLNSLFSVILDYTISHKLNIIDCLDASKIKMESRSKGEKSHEKEYATVKEIINNKTNEKSLIFDVKFNENNSYEFLSILYKGEETKFQSEDIIIDFFDAINYTDKLKNEGFFMSYTERFREFLKTNGIVCSGCIYNEDLIKATDIAKYKGTKNGSILIQNYKPSIFKNEMTKLDELLDYINKNRK